jgi:hypothetical protein
MENLNEKLGWNNSMKTHRWKNVDENMDETFWMKKSDK